MSEETIRDVIENCRDELVNGKYIQREHEMLDREEVLTKSRQLMFRLMDNLEKNIMH